MANKVTNEDILRINELYFQYKNYSEVARQTGFSASTVKKYVDKNWNPPVAESIKFNLDSLPHFDKALEVFKNYEDYGLMCGLSEQEEDEIRELWKEIAI